MNSKLKVRPLVLPEKKIILLTNGKCGGTSLHRWFFMLLDEPLDRKSFSDIAKSFSLEFALKYKFIKFFKGDLFTSNNDSDFRSFVSLYRDTVCEKWISTVENEEFLKIIVVRDPVKRCLSGYIDKFCGEDSSGQYVQDVIKKFPGQKGISFRQFVEYLESEENDRVNGHWRRQSFVLDHVDAKFELVRLEDFDEEIRGVFPNRFGFIPKLPYRNTGEALEEREIVGFPAFDITSDRLIQEKKEGNTFPSKSSFLNTDLVRRIKRIYIKDYKVLPYE